MKKNLFFGGIVALIILTVFSACSKQESQQGAEESTAVSSDDETNQKLENYFDIPIYPGAKLADIFTINRDDKIPDKKIDTSVKLIVDNYEKVVQFYEAKLGQKFFVDENNGKNYYTLRFEKDGWLFEIYIGQDTYMNQPIYEIQMMQEE